MGKIGLFPGKTEGNMFSVWIMWYKPVLPMAKEAEKTKEEGVGREAGSPDPYFYCQHSHFNQGP